MLVIYKAGTDIHIDVNYYTNASQYFKVRSSNQLIMNYY